MPPTATASHITTEAQYEVGRTPGAAARTRHWLLAEMSGNRWFAAEERDETTRSIRRLLSPELRHLAPFIRRNSNGRWRCFVYMADVGHGEGTVFEEIVSVTDLSNLGMLVFRLRSGLLGTEKYSTSVGNYVGGEDEQPPPLIKGEQVFEWH